MKPGTLAPWALLLAISLPSSTTAAQPTADMVAQDWARFEANVLAMVEAVPENLLDFRPTPEDKSYAELIEELVRTNLTLVGYGIVGRVLRSVADLARKEGIKAGVIRPVTLWPFPRQPIDEAADRAQRFLVAELSHGQMVEDVRLVVNGRRPVAFYGRCGGNVPTAAEILDAIKGKGE